MSETKGVHIFSNGTEFEVWESRNCSRCVKEPTCDLLAALFTDGLSDGLYQGQVFPETADRLGYSEAEHGARADWDCKERQERTTDTQPAEHVISPLNRDGGMKGLSLWQPWASLIAWGEKRIETRSWATRYRGLLAIHATKLFPQDAQALCFQEPFRSVLKSNGITVPADLPRGAIVAVARLADCRSTGRDRNDASRLWVGSLSDQELDFGDYTPGRFGWLLEDVRALPEPIPCRGGQGLWGAPDDVVSRIDRQLDAGSEPRWPAPSVEGEWIQLPGMDEVAERPAERGGYPS